MESLKHGPRAPPCPADNRPDQGFAGYFDKGKASTTEPTAHGLSSYDSTMTNFAAEMEAANIRFGGEVQDQGETWNAGGEMAPFSFEHDQMADSSEEEEMIPCPPRLRKPRSVQQHEADDGEQHMGDMCPAPPRLRRHGR